MGRTSARAVKFYDREAMMLEFAPLIRVSVEQIQDSSPLPLDSEDLLAAALTGLFEAIKSYDPTVDKNFRSFAELNIRRAIMAEIRPTADFFQHVQIQPVGPAEAVRHSPKLTNGYDWKGHKFKVH